MASEGGGARGGLGWVILAAALAVPGFLFYNWWSHLKAEHDRGVSAKARTRAEGGVFQASPTAGRLINPMSPSTSAPAGFPPPAAGQSVAPGLASAPPPGAVPAAPMPQTISAAPGAVAMSSAATVVLPRDPMMSPLDMVHVQEAEIEAAARLQALADAAAQRGRPYRRPPPPKQKPIETRIELQGIVAKADGDNLAIINGATVNPGEKFSVEGYAGKVLILKITSAVVTLEYKGRKIKLSVNTE
jgi:hypothetical protein